MRPESRDQNRTVVAACSRAAGRVPREDHEAVIRHIHPRFADLGPHALEADGLTEDQLFDAFLHLQVRDFRLSPARLRQMTDPG